MEADSFLTIQQPATGQYKEKGSKFLSFAFPVEREEQIKSELDGIRKKYFDARHYCYAWVLGADKTRFRANDDGEPNHSAGDPILGQIRARDLTDVLVVVVRYFGGTKLGVGGLVNAYRTATRAALEQAKVVEKEVYVCFWAQFDYSFTPEIMRLIKDFDIIVIDQRYDHVTNMKCSVSKKQIVGLKERIQLLQALGISVKVQWD